MRDDTRPAARAGLERRGFTLVELMITLAVAGLLLGISVWSMQHFIVGSRVGAAAREFMARARSAQTIAARANRPVELRFVQNGDTGCLPRYEIRTTGTGAATYDTVCLATEYPGVQLSSGAMGTTAVKCGTEAEIQSCTLCTGTKTITFFPSGAVTTSGVDADGDSVVFSVRGDTSPGRTLAVGLRNVTGRARVYRPNASASEWECP